MLPVVFPFFCVIPHCFRACSISRLCEFFTIIIDHIHISNNIDEASFDLLLFSCFESIIRSSLSKSIEVNKRLKKRKQQTIVSH